jgi:hypothetical protein
VSAAKLISVTIYYKQTSSGSGYLPGLEFRQTNGIYMDYLNSHPGFKTPSTFYDEYEKTINGVAVARTAYFAVAKNTSKGYLTVRGYTYGEFATKGLYQEAWMKMR